MKASGTICLTLNKKPINQYFHRVLALTVNKTSGIRLSPRIAELLYNTKPGKLPAAYKCRKDTQLLVCSSVVDTAYL